MKMAVFYVVVLYILVEVFDIAELLAASTIRVLIIVLMMVAASTYEASINVYQTTHSHLHFITYSHCESLKVS